MCTCGTTPPNNSVKSQPHFQAVRVGACVRGSERRFLQLHPSLGKTGDLQSSGSALNLLSKICMLIESGEEGKQSKVREMTANQSAHKEKEAPAIL